MSRRTPEEERAVLGMREAVVKVLHAIQRANEVGFGSQVLGPLEDALKQIRHAVAVAEGRT